MSATADDAPSTAHEMNWLKNWQLFAICVLAWGTTWYAITFQIGHTAPEVAVAMRFALAGALVLTLCAARGLPLSFAFPDHVVLALQGFFMYGVSYLCVYHAERHVVSGLVAVGYSASPLVAGLGGHALLGLRVSRRFVTGGLVGVAGVALMFWTEFGRAAAGQGATLGLAFIACAVLLSSAGSLIATRNRARGLPFWPALGFGMLYGAATAMLIAVLLGRSFALPMAVSWWLSLLYLALVGSVLAFACFLTLQERVGPGRAGAIGVMTPLLALTVSMVFEGFHPDALTLIGAGLAVAGNVLILRRAR
jgi:drug/metabolite transporter (DMT)-like permease